MKKISRNRKVTPKRTEHERNARQVVGEDAEPPEVRRYFKEIEATYRQPTHFELAQIAALLNGNNNRAGLIPNHLQGVLENEDKLFVTDAALGLWQRCGQTQRERLEYDARLLEYGNSPEFFTSVAALEEGFPLRFDSALKYIVGKTIRRGFRHKRFHAFLRVTIPGANAKEEERDLIAGNRISELKKIGFSQECFEEMKQLYSQWEANQAKEKASLAAKKRWAKSAK